MRILLLLLFYIHLYFKHLSSLPRVRHQNILLLYFIILFILWSEIAAVEWWIGKENYTLFLFLMPKNAHPIFQFHSHVHMRQIHTHTNSMRICFMCEKLHSAVFGCCCSSAVCYRSFSHLMFFFFCCTAHLIEWITSIQNRMEEENMGVVSECGYINIEHCTPNELAKVCVFGCCSAGMHSAAWL